MRNSFLPPKHLTEITESAAISPVDTLVVSKDTTPDSAHHGLVPIDIVLKQAKQTVRLGDVEAGLDLVRTRLRCAEDRMFFVGDPIVDVAFVAAGREADLLESYSLAWDAGIWPKPDMRAYCEYKSECGIPPIFICTLPKSGSLYISEMIRSSLVLQDVRISLDLYPRDYLIPEMVSFLAAGGVSSWEHTDPSDRNLEILKSAGLTRFVLHLRDPRQTAVSFIHHIDRNLTGENLFYRWRFNPRIPEWYNRAPFGRKVDWYLETRFTADIEWIRRWLAVARSEEFEILVTHFEDLRGNEAKYLEHIVKFFRIPDLPRKFDVPDPTMSAHFRSGALEEWRSVCSPAQQENMWQTIGDVLGAEMGWKR